MPIVPALPTFTANTLAVAEDITTALTNIRDTVNTYGVLTDVARTVTVTHTYTASQTFTGGFSAGAACTISTGGLTLTAGGLTVSADGITVTGNSTITGTLGGVTTLTATTGAFTTLSGAVNFSGTPTYGAGLTVTTGTCTFPTLNVTTLYPTDAQVPAAGSGMTFKGTVANGAKQFLTWVDAQARVQVGIGAAAIVLGQDSALAAISSIGFVHLVAIADTPTGTPTATGGVPLCFDTTNNRLWAYHTSDWHYVAFTATP